jgi:hypothetical protein
MNQLNALSNRVEYYATLVKKLLFLNRSAPCSNNKTIENDFKRCHTSQ